MLEFASLISRPPNKLALASNRIVPVRVSFLSMNKSPDIPTAARIEIFAGGLLVAMMLFSIAADIFDASSSAGRALLLMSGLSAWFAGFCLVARVRQSQKIVIGVLLIAGASLLFFVKSRSGDFPWYRLITVNAGLLTMIISVGFLKLIAESGFTHAGPLPQGRKSFRDTVWTVAIFGSFINISAPVLVADRLSLNRPLDLFACSTVTKTFSGCSAWSPFFGGMAVVLTYVEDMRLLLVMMVAFPFAALGLLLIYYSACIFSAEKVESFRGYPMKLSSLWIPAVLACLIISLFFGFPGLSILTVIALGSLLLTVVALCFQTSMPQAAAKLSDFINFRLRETANELTLFLVAGVLAVGLAGLVDLGILVLPFNEFNATTASLLLAIMIFIAMMGIHPVIQVAGFTPLLLVADPNPQLLALTYMFAWSLGTCGSPLSGTHLVMQGRYGIECWKGALTNWPFVICMYAVGVVLLHVMARVSV